MYPTCIRNVSDLYTKYIRLVYEMYPTCIRNVSDLYTKCIRLVYEMYPICIRLVYELHPIFIRFLLNIGHKKFFGFLSDFHPSFLIELLSDVRPIIVRFVSDYCPICIRLLSDLYPIVVRFVSDCCPICIRLLSDLYPMLMSDCCPKLSDFHPSFLPALYRSATAICNEKLFDLAKTRILITALGYDSDSVRMKFVPESGRVLTTQLQILAKSEEFF
jgi:hypothetical protein